MVDHWQTCLSRDFRGYYVNSKETLEKPGFGATEIFQAFIQAGQFRLPLLQLFHRSLEYTVCLLHPTGSVHAFRFHA